MNNKIYDAQRLGFGCLHTQNTLGTRFGRCCCCQRRRCIYDPFLRIFLYIFLWHRRLLDQLAITLYLGVMFVFLCVLCAHWVYCNNECAGRSTTTTAMVMLAVQFYFSRLVSVSLVPYSKIIFKCCIWCDRKISLSAVTQRPSLVGRHKPKCTLLYVKFVLFRVFFFLVGDACFIMCTSIAL